MLVEETPRQMHHFADGRNWFQTPPVLDGEFNQGYWTARGHVPSQNWNPPEHRPSTEASVHAPNVAVFSTGQHYFGQDTGMPSASTAAPAWFHHDASRSLPAQLPTCRPAPAYAHMTTLPQYSNQYSGMRGTYQDTSSPSYAQYCSPLYQLINYTHGADHLQTDVPQILPRQQTGIPQNLPGQQSIPQHFPRQQTGIPQSLPRQQSIPQHFPTQQTSIHQNLPRQQTGIPQSLPSQQSIPQSLTKQQTGIPQNIPGQQTGIPQNVPSQPPGYSGMGVLTPQFVHGSYLASGAVEHGVPSDTSSSHSFQAPISSGSAFHQMHTDGSAVQTTRFPCPVNVPVASKQIIRRGISQRTRALNRVYADAVSSQSRTSVRGSSPLENSALRYLLSDRSSKKTRRSTRKRPAKLRDPITTSSASVPSSTAAAQERSKQNSVDCAKPIQSRPLISDCTRDNSGWTHLHTSLAGSLYCKKNLTLEKEGNNVKAVMETWDEPLSDIDAMKSAHCQSLCNSSAIGTNETATCIVEGSESAPSTNETSNISSNSDASGQLENLSKGTQEHTPSYDAKTLTVGSIESSAPNEVRRLQAKLQDSVSQEQKCTDVYHTCLVCKKTFSDSDLLEKHLMEHMEDSELQNSENIVSLLENDQLDNEQQRELIVKFEDACSHRDTAGDVAQNTTCDREKNQMKSDENLRNLETSIDKNCSKITEQAKSVFDESSCPETSTNSQITLGDEEHTKAVRHQPECTCHVIREITSDPKRNLVANKLQGMTTKTLIEEMVDRLLPLYHSEQHKARSPSHDQRLIRTLKGADTDLVIDLTTETAVPASSGHVVEDASTISLQEPNFCENCNNSECPQNTLSSKYQEADQQGDNLQIALGDLNPETSHSSEKQCRPMSDLQIVGEKNSMQLNTRHDKLDHMKTVPHVLEESCGYQYHRQCATEEIRTADLEDSSSPTPLQSYTLASHVSASESPSVSRDTTASPQATSEQVSGAHSLKRSGGRDGILDVLESCLPSKKMKSVDQQKFLQNEERAGSSEEGTCPALNTMHITPGLQISPNSSLQQSFSLPTEKECTSHVTYASTSVSLAETHNLSHKHEEIQACLRNKEIRMHKHTNKDSSNADCNNRASTTGGQLKINTEKLMKSLKAIARDASGKVSKRGQRSSETCKKSVAIESQKKKYVWKDSSNSQSDTPKQNCVTPGLRPKDPNTEIIFCVQCFTVFTKKDVYDNHGCRTMQILSSSSEDSEEESDFGHGSKRSESQVDGAYRPFHEQTDVSEKKTTTHSNKLSQKDRNQSSTPAKKAAGSRVTKSGHKGRKRKRFRLSSCKHSKHKRDKSVCPSTRRPPKRLSQASGNPSVFTCDHCQQVFSSRGGLLFHWNAFHKKFNSS